MALVTRDPRQVAEFGETKSAIPQASGEAWTTCDFDDETFASVEFYSEIEEQGLGLVRSFGHAAPQDQAVFQQFRAFVRQPRSFFDAARALHHRASPLLYYYALLNLAKAI